jgi:choline dehydrogenase
MVTTEATSEWFTAEPGTLLFGIGLVKPHSVGRLWLDSADPEAPPRIWLNFFDDPNDLKRVLRGIQVARDLLQTPALGSFAGKEMFPGESSPGDLEELVRSSTPAYAHPTSTCRMGRDATVSVVDQTGRVHGMRDLWVIDASIMPSLPSVPTNATTMMLAERCVGWMLGREPLPKELPL